jgi:G3E family GTPase
MTDRIPVTIITGFLGSGKTTLLNNIISTYKMKKFAIIENEFGEIGIDGGLIVGADENIFELSNGCICCSLNDDFYETLLKLLDGDYEFNHLLIETTGIADPDTIIQAFISSEKIQMHFMLDSVVALADAVNLEDVLDEQPEVRKQLALADIVLLNKTDAIRGEYQNELRKLIATINPTAPVYPVAFANISDIELLDTYSFSGKTIEKTTLSFQNLKVIKAEVDNRSFVHVRQKEHHHTIKTEGFVVPAGFDYDRFSFWIRNFITFNSNNIYRIKGIVCFDKMDDRFIFHSIRSDYMFEKGKPWDDETRFSKLIFIGKNFDRDTIEEHLYQLIPD